MKVLREEAKNLACLFLMLFGFAAVSFSQTTTAMPTPTPKLIIPTLKENTPVAEGNNLYCAGYIQKAPVNTNVEIVGSNKEREQYTYAQGDFVYINRGANSGSRVGDVFSVIRPRGRFRTDLSKKGNLGIYVQELGMLEVVKVMPEVSVAVIKNSCQAMLLGDLAVSVPARVSPIFQTRPALEQFGQPSGKARGRIIMARDSREMLSRDEIAYIDLGAEDNVRVGDYLTIFRSLGKGNVISPRDEVSLNNSSNDYGSKVYKGGKFSNQAPRKSGSSAGGSIVKTSEAKKGRPQNLREVVGEMVVINVKERTATVVITRNATEIHTGDMVEIQ